MVDTVWKIGDIVYGVHSEVSDGKCIIGISEEKIIKFEENYWVCEGTFLGHHVMSNMFSAYDTYSDAVNAAKITAMEADIVAIETPSAWKEVVRMWDE